MVATHSHLVLEPGQPGRALADFFRLEGGKVVEQKVGAVGKTDVQKMLDAHVATPASTPAS